MIWTQLVFLSSLLLALSSLLGLHLRKTERLFSLSIVRALVGLFFVIVAYLQASGDLSASAATAVLSAEAVWALTWAFMANRMHALTASKAPESLLLFLSEPAAGIALTTAAWWAATQGLFGELYDGAFVFPPYGPAYGYELLVLLSMLFSAWRLESFWRSLPPSQRWEYRLFIVASSLVCVAYVFALSYRITFLAVAPDQVPALAVVLMLAWPLSFYAIARHRLLNRKLFLSRQIVYASVAPFFFGIYLLGVGLVSILMRQFGWPVPEILLWLAAALGFVAAGLYLCSGRLRRRVHYFISTHFYLNKHDYRDIWRTLSYLLKGASDEAVIARGVARVLSDTLYAVKLMIWIGSESKGYRPAWPEKSEGNGPPSSDIAGDDPVVAYLKSGGHFYLEEKGQGEDWKRMLDLHGAWMIERGVVLLAPISLGDQLLGLIGLGRELTGGRYGPHDFDLLSAVGTQAASALLTVRMAEELGVLRQREAWSALSAFVLHDIKNAAAMLSLVSANAREHIDNPEFQRDMLEAIENALQRMAKVQKHLSALRSEITPRWETADLCQLLEGYLSRESHKLVGLRLTLECPQPLPVETDPALLATVLENLLLNSLEAGGPGTEAALAASRDDHGRVVLTLTDNGPGIPPDLLPDKLFDPFQTTKPSGSGIGLWQARRLLESLGGTIRAEERGEGARFVVTLLEKRAD